MDWVDKVLKIILITALILLTLQIGSYSRNLYMVNKLSTTGTELTYGETFAGFYMENGWTCYDTKRTESQVNRTIYHENCHALINDDREHYLEAFT